MPAADRIPQKGAAPDGRRQDAPRRQNQHPALMLNRAIGNRAMAQLVQREPQDVEEEQGAEQETYEDLLKQYVSEQLDPLREGDGDPAAFAFAAMADEIASFAGELIDAGAWSSTNAAWVFDLTAELMTMKALKMGKGGHFSRTEQQRDDTLDQLAKMSAVAKLRDELPQTMTQNKRKMPVMAKIGAVAGWVLSLGLGFPVVVAFTEAHAKRLNAKVLSKIKQAKKSSGYWDIKKDIDGVLGKEPQHDDVTPLKPALERLIDAVFEARNVGEKVEDLNETAAAKHTRTHLTGRFFLTDAYKAERRQKKAATQKAEKGEWKGWTGKKKDTG